jgi:hypothetical protein
MSELTMQTCHADGMTRLHSVAKRCGIHRRIGGVRLTLMPRGNQIWRGKRSATDATRSELREQSKSAYLAEADNRAETIDRWNWPGWIEVHMIFVPTKTVQIHFLRRRQLCLGLQGI